MAAKTNISLLMEKPNVETPPAKSPNSLSSLFWGFCALGFGIYRLVETHRMPLTLTAKIFAVASIACGALLMLASVLLIWSQRTISGAAQKTHDQNKTIYGGKHEREMVEPGAIAAAGLDAAFYEKTTAELEQIGFVRQADYVNVTLRRAMPNSKAIIRSLIGEDGRVMGAVYHARIAAAMKTVNARTVEMETELSDGTFVITSNASLAAKTVEFTGISRRFLADGSTPAALLSAHRSHVAETLADRPGVTTVSVRNYVELQAAQDRLQLLKVRFRNSSDFDPAVEIRRIAGKPLNKAQQDFAAQTARLHAETVANALKQPPAI